MATLLVAEHSNDKLNGVTAKALSAAKGLGGEVDILVAGNGCRPAAEAAARLDGVGKVLIAEAPHLEHQVAEPLAALLVGLADRYEAILAPSTTTSRNVLPRVAALLDVMQVSDITKVVAPDTFERPIYAGNAIQTVQATDARKVITVRTAAFQAAGEGTGAAPIEAVEAGADPGLSRYVGEELQKSDRPELTSARVIISGGRALGSKENFRIIERVADKLGAAVGASRAAVDAGYAPNDWQVGQTGKVVGAARLKAGGL
jgi:electron transfer flavoprotein alpha subunit